jgi:hypothetical protein
VGVYLIALPLPDTRKHHASSKGPSNLDVPSSLGEGQSLLNGDEVAEDDVLIDFEPSASPNAPALPDDLMGISQATLSTAPPPLRGRESRYGWDRAQALGSSERGARRASSFKGKTPSKEVKEPLSPHACLKVDPRRVSVTIYSIYQGWWAGE